MSARDRLVECPACDGYGGEHAPTNGLFGSGSYEDWYECGMCDGDGRVTRRDRLAFLINEAWEEEARMAWTLARVRERAGVRP